MTSLHPKVVAHLEARGIPFEEQYRLPIYPDDDEFIKHEGGGHDQKSHGNWAGGSRAETLVDVTKEQGGLTFDVKTGQFREEGFAVATPESTEKVVPLDAGPGDDWTEEGVDIVTRYLEDHADMLAQPNVHLGTWIDEGKVYLDLSAVVTSPDEAADVSRATDQIAFFDLGTFTEWRRDDEQRYHPVKDDGSLDMSVSKASSHPVIWTRAVDLADPEMVRKLVEHLVAESKTR